MIVKCLLQKEEAGEVRLEVDFEQLKIENEQLRERLEEKNQTLLRLKLSSGNSMQVLNSYKVRTIDTLVQSIIWSFTAKGSRIE